MTTRLGNWRRCGRSVALCGATCVVLLALAGCASGNPASGTSAGSADATAAGGHGAVAVDVQVTREAVANKPAASVLKTPEAAVRSYLDWTSYAYRIGQAQVASATMSPAEQVRVDGYIQLNLQKSRLIDQTLSSIKFGKASTEGTHTLLPAVEKWTYRYVSVTAAGQTVEGPYPAGYDTTYTVVRSGGGWVVDSVNAKATGEVK